MSKHHKKRGSGRTPTKAEQDQYATVLNRTSEAFWKSRGYPSRPSDWKTATPTHQRRPSRKKPH